MSVEVGEVYSTLVELPLAPLRVVVAIGVFLLLIQGVSKFIRDIFIARGVQAEDRS
ncbi:hypothetical protein ES703_100628 [subsurface metagenome]